MCSKHLCIVCIKLVMVGQWFYLSCTLWAEFSFENKKNVICGIFYRQHNSPEIFQSYFDETIEKFAFSDL